MEMERKALYNLLRMNWQLDSGLEVEDWQVEDYRSLTTEELFENLATLGLSLDKTTFLAYSEDSDTPEELSEQLSPDDVSPIEADQFYLLLFELWRRFVPEKQSLSIFCDELDHLIFDYDRGSTKDLEDLQDIIADLQRVLEENLDEGGSSQEVFSAISQACANDLSTFLYDFISDQVDIHNIAYARELFEGFEDFVEKSAWFCFLEARLLSKTEPEKAYKLVKDLLEESDRDLELNLEILSYMLSNLDLALFKDLVLDSLDLLELESDFLDLTEICLEYFEQMEQSESKQRLESLLKQRESKSTSSLEESDLGIKDFRRLIETLDSERVSS